MSQPTDFIKALWGDTPPGLIPLWELKTKRSWYLGTPQAAQVIAASHPVDLYVSTALAHADHGKDKRINARQAVAITGVWLDIDVDGTPDGRGGVKTGAAPTRTDALALAGSLVKPSIAVNSGGGIHCWWLLDRPWRFADAAEQDRAAGLVWRWQEAHRQAVDYTVDSTHDLARLLRLPGTLNGKSDPPAPVEVMWQDGPTYPLERLEGLCEHVSGRPNTPEGDDDDVTAELGTPLPRSVIDELCGRDGRFALAWRHERRDIASMSEYDLALCSLGVQLGLDDQQLADLVLAHRIAQDHEPRKALRPDYIRSTILKARDQQAPGQHSEPAPAVETGDGGQRKGSLTASQWADVILAGLEAEQGPVIPLPWPSLSEALDGGLTPGDVVLVCAHTGDGKSVVCDQIADLAASMGKKVHVYLTEMTAYERGLRYLARQGVRFSDLRRRELNQQQWSKVVEALEKLPYGCSVVSDWTVDDMVADIRENEWDLAIVDLVHGFHYRDERDLSRTSSAMVKAAKGGSADGKATTIVMAAHLNDGQMRDSKSPVRPKPGLHSIKGASSLKQDADVILFLWQEQDEDGRQTGDGWVWFGKARQGNVAAPPVQLTLDKAWLRFEIAGGHREAVRESEAAF